MLVWFWSLLGPEECAWGLRVYFDPENPDGHGALASGVSAIGAVSGRLLAFPVPSPVFLSSPLLSSPLLSSALLCSRVLSPRLSSRLLSSSLSSPLPARSNAARQMFNIISKIKRGKLGSKLRKLARWELEGIVVYRPGFGPNTAADSSIAYGCFMFTAGFSFKHMHRRNRRRVNTRFRVYMNVYDLGLGIYDLSIVATLNAHAFPLATEPVSK